MSLVVPNCRYVELSWPIEYWCLGIKGEKKRKEKKGRKKNHRKDKTTPTSWVFLGYGCRTQVALV
jgi:hypothetical protein